MELTSDMEYAGFWRRFNAYGVDATLVQIATWVIGWQLGLDTGSSIDLKTFQALIVSAQSGVVDPALTTLLADGIKSSFSGGSFISLVDDKLFIVLSALYNIIFIAGVWQATPGKRWLGLKVTSKSGARLTLLESATRHAASGLSMLAAGIGYITLFFTKEKLAPHDMICQTRVIRVRNPL
jgi:uncharacterized RDD family membrane protein YckC